MAAAIAVEPVGPAAAALLVKGVRDEGGGGAGVGGVEVWGQSWLGGGGEAGVEAVAGGGAVGALEWGAGRLMAEGGAVGLLMTFCRLETWRRLVHLQEQQPQ